MSYELDSSPPKGTKYSWNPKALNYSPWVLGFSNQKEKDLRKERNNRFLSFWPMDIICYVDLIDGTYTWSVRVIDFSHIQNFKRGESKTALQALKEAEKYAEQEYKKLTPKWVMTALSEGWRTP